jgi:hypothetical protein
MTDAEVREAIARIAQEERSRPKAPICEPKDCPTCKRGETLPPHYPSQKCESGGRAHCACDVCF